MALAVGACTNPRANNPPANNSPTPERPEPAPKLSAKLIQRAKQGEKIRAERTLKVREQTRNDIVVLEGMENTESEMLSVDEIGRALIVKRHYQQSTSRIGSEGGRSDETRNPLHGYTLELRREANGVAGAKIIEGPAGIDRLAWPDIGNQKFLIDGFDAALLPRDEVKEGDRWEVLTQDLDRPGGLNSLIAAQGFKVEKNELNVRVSELTQKRATLELDWRITGSFDKLPAVMVFSGSLEFSREQELITRFTLNGGRQGEAGGYARQVTISVGRSK